jgi:hypothetical protein
LDNEDRKISFYIQTFLNRPNFSTPSQLLSAELGGCSHIRLGKDIGFWLGNVVVGDSEDGLTVRGGSPVANIEQTSRYQGELDVGIMFPRGPTLGVLSVKTAADILDVAIPFLATSLKEHFVPVAEIQIEEWLGSACKQLASPQIIRLEAKERATISVAMLTQAFDKFCCLIDTMPIEELRGLAVASRRLNSAMSEDDVIDKYCDFWECCEFLATPGKTVNGIRLPNNKEAAVIKLLRSYARPRIPKSLIDKVHEIYTIRNDLVHRAIENPSEVEKNMRIIGEIAHQLFRLRAGIPFEGSAELAPLLV